MSKIFVFLFSFVVLAYVLVLNQLKSDNTGNLLSQKLRPAFLKSEVLRKTFFLNKPGDGRFAYLAKKKNTVLIEVDYQRGQEPDERLKEWMDDIVRSILNKNAEIEVKEEEGIPDGQDFSDRELPELAKKLRNFSPDSSKSYLHLVYVSRSKDVPTNTGLVLTDRDVFIFKQAIRNLAERESIRSRIEESTLMHEFGHLLGLEHVADENCVMNEKVEVYGNRRRQNENIPIDFCDSSLDELEKLKKEAN